MEQDTTAKVRIMSKPRLNDHTPSDKIRVLWYSDFLRHTGFGNVAEEIMSRLIKTGKYEFEVVAINYRGEPYNIPASDYFKFKDVPVHPANSVMPQDVLGHYKLAQLLSEKNFDLLFVLQDAFNLIPVKPAILEAKKRKDFRYIFYFPVDGDFKKEWVSEAVQVADFPIVYTKFGQKKIKEINPSINLDYIYHGADLETFRPFENEEERNRFRQDYFMTPKDEEEFIITNVNRNQPRKDLTRFLLAFKLFTERYPEIKSKVYLHCKTDDPAGHKIAEFARHYFPKESFNRLIIPSPEAFGANGYGIETVRKVYAASDVISSTTLGEGWGLSTTEAMACETPVVMPNNTSATEIIGENEERGYLVKSGGDVNLTVTFKHDNELVRPLTDINDLVEKWKYVYDHKEEAKEKAKLGREWLKQYTWDIIANKWDELFQKAYKTLK